nr:TetR family transcriptional regulator [Streptomyces malaysiensis]
MSKAQAQENREHVVAVASRMFREQGISVRIADLMKAAGLTHGAFYKQFASKDDLVDKAIAYAFEDPTAHPPMPLEECAEGCEAVRRTLIEQYLSTWHRDHTGEGCPVAGFAADLGRSPDQATRSQDVYVKALRNRAARLGSDDNGMVQLCTMVGALLLARATRGNPISEELLQAARAALTETGPGRSEPQARRLTEAE